MRTKKVCSFLKGMNPDSYLSGHDLSSVALKVQAVERELSLEGLPYQSEGGVTPSGSTWSRLIAFLTSLINT